MTPHVNFASHMKFQIRPTARFDNVKIFNFDEIRKTITFLRITCRIVNTLHIIFMQSTFVLYSMFTNKNKFRTRPNIRFDNTKIFSYDKKTLWINKENYLFIFSASPVEPQISYIIYRKYSFWYIYINFSIQ